MGALFAIRLWRIKVIWKSILGNIRGRNHFHATTAQGLLPPLAIVIHMLEMFMEFQNIDRIKDLIFQLFCLLILQIEPVRLGSRQYECPFCTKILLGSKENMKIHIRTHTGEKPFSCDYCPKSFSQNGNLNAHVKNVHGIPKYW